MYTVAFIDFFSNEILFKKVEATSVLEAMKKSDFLEYDEEDYASTEEKFKTYAFDCDSMINAVED